MMTTTREKFTHKIDCPVCNNARRDCRSTGDLIFCRSDETPPPGWRSLGVDAIGFGMYAEGDGKDFDRTEFDRRRQQRAATQAAALANSLPPEQRDRWYRDHIASGKLSPAHRQDLERRGLTTEQIAALPVWSRQGFGYAIAFPNINGELHGAQWRVDNPEDGKYVWHSGLPGGQKLPIGEMPLAVYQVSNPTVIALVEGTGVKPLLAAQRLNAIAIGAAGGQHTASPQQLSAVIAAYPNLPIVIVPDAGDIVNSQVMKRHRQTAAHLPGAMFLWWGQETKEDSDIDELIDLESIEYLTAEQFLSKVAPRYDWEVPKTSQIKRLPSLHLGKKPFTEVVSKVPASGIVALWGGKGTEKSKAIAAIVQGQSWVSITSLVSLAIEQAEAFGGVFVNQADQYQGQFLKGGQVASGVSVCAPSLLKAQGLQPEILVLDELTATLKFLLSSKLCNREGIRPLLLAEFERRVREAQLVLIADADLDQASLEYIERIRGEKTFLVRSDLQPLNWSGSFIQGTRHQAIAEFLGAVEALPPGQIIYMNSDSKRLVETLSELLTVQGIGTLLITQGTSGGTIERSFLQSKGADLPALALSGVRVILSSPSVCQGFSIEQNTDLIASVWAFYQGGSIDVASIAQSLDRVRGLHDRTIWIAEKGRAYSKLSPATEIDQFLLDFQNAGSATARLARLSLTPETRAKVDAIDWQGENIKLLANFETKRNQGMTALKSTLQALLASEGKRIVERRSTTDRAALTAVTRQLTEVRNRLENERCQAIASAPDLTEAEVTTLDAKSKLQPLTQGELHATEKFYLASFYRSEVDFDAVAFDRRGQLRSEVRNLESIIFKEVALERTAKSIEQNPTTPQDWDRAELRRELIDCSGAGDLIRQIWQGKVTHLTADIVDPIAATIRGTLANDFKLTTGFKNLDKISDNQIVFSILDWVGIRRRIQQRRIEGKPTREYFVDTTHLKKLKIIVERRFQSVSPPQEMKLDQGDDTGGSPSDFDPWLTPESLLDTRNLWRAAQSEEERELIRPLIPPKVLELAISA